MGRNVCADIQYLSQVRGTSLADFVVLVCTCARLLHGGVNTSKGDQLLRLLETRKITNLSQNDNGSILADSGDALRYLHMALKGPLALCCFKNLALYLICCTLYLYQHLSKQSNKRFERAALDLKLHGLFCYIKQMVRFLHCIGGFCISSSRKCNGFCNINAVCAAYLLRPREAGKNSQSRLCTQAGKDLAEPRKPLIQQCSQLIGEFYPLRDNIRPLAGEVFQGSDKDRIYGITSKHFEQIELGDPFGISTVTLYFLISRFFMLPDWSGLMTTTSIPERRRYVSRIL